MPRRSILRFFFEVLAVTVLLAVFTRSFILQGVAVPTRSMEPSLLPGDHVIVNKQIFALSQGRSAGRTILGRLLPSREIRRSDILLLRLPGAPGALLIKRCVGLPGESLEIIDNRVFINGRRVDESAYLGPPPPVSPRASSRRGRAQLAATKIPENAFFVLGDNRTQSIDSRELGSFPRSTVVGRVVLVYWSFDRSDTRRGLRRLLATARDFVSRTRWQRTFEIVR